MRPIGNGYSFQTCSLVEPLPHGRSSEKELATARLLTVAETCDLEHVYFDLSLRRDCVPIAAVSRRKRGFSPESLIACLDGFLTPSDPFRHLSWHLP
jgi:hypothetical protein